MRYIKEDENVESNLIKLSDDFLIMIKKVRKGYDDLAWDLLSLDSNPEIRNTIGIEEVDVSDKPWHFSVKQNGRWGQIKISQFLKYFFKNKFTEDEIYKFSLKYNNLVGLYQSKDIGNDIKPREFKFEPTNVKETFISLVTETYPMGHEEEVIPYITPGLTRDKYGNYYKIIGDSDTAFTCHLDTASRIKSKIVLKDFVQDGQNLIMSDGKTILGADDKAGVTILMYMISKGVPGVYWFFMGEERGGIGSGKVANNYGSYPFMKGIKKMVSFDRRNYYSVITSQMGIQCCSNEFADSLCKELNKGGLSLNLDPTGVFTDSANFIDLIPECTNVSVGYFNEHTHDEIQNITYLEKLSKACVSAQWENLKVVRKVGFDEEVLAKYNKLIKSFKKMRFWNEDSISSVEGKLEIKLTVCDPDPNHLHTDLTEMQEIFSRWKIEPDITFSEDQIKIILN